jgi:hypothetical protein
VFPALGQAADPDSAPGHGDREPDRQAGAGKPEARAAGYVPPVPATAAAASFEGAAGR